MIKNAKFISEWKDPDITFEGNCKVDMNTGIVFDIEIDCDYNDLRVLYYEGVVIDDIHYCADWRDESNAYSIRFACADMLQEVLMTMEGDEFNCFCGLPVDRNTKEEFLFNIIFDMSDNDVMSYFHKYYL